MITKIEEKIERLAPWLYLLLIMLAVLASVIVGGFVLHQQHQIKAASDAIQQERVDSILRSCADQNKRHGAAVTALDNLLKQSGVPKKKRKASAKPILGLIDALAPMRNCAKVVELSVPSGEIPPPPPN